MAGLDLVVSSGAIALNGATAQTFLIIAAPAQQRLLIKSILVTFRGLNPVDPQPLIELTRPTTTYASNGLAATINKRNPSDGETIQSTAAVFVPASTTEPGTSTVLKPLYIHGQGGYERQFAPDEEYVVKGGGFFGVRITGSAGQTFNAIVNVEYEE